MAVDPPPPRLGRQAWERRLEQAQGSGIAALALFAQRLTAYLHAVLSRCRHPPNTSIAKVINNIIKRRAYGYRDQEYFLPKTRAAFPGVG